MKLIDKIKDNFIVPPKTKNHILWIDVAKGIGIFLIVYGHILYAAKTTVINQFLYSFHVPFFFVLSGFVFLIKEDEKFFSFMYKKSVRILVPLFCFVLIGLIVALAKHYGNTELLIRYFFYYDGTYDCNMPCWFFITLFFIYIIGYLIKLPKLEWYVKLIITIAFFCAGFVIYQQMPFIKADENPFMRFGIDKTIFVTGFFVFGSLLNDLYKKYDFTKHKLILLAVLAVSLGLCILFGVILNPKTSLYARELHNYWAFIGSGIFGSISMMIVAIYLSYVKYVRSLFLVWGANIILIAGTHYVFMYPYLWFKSLFNPLLGTYWTDLFVPLYVIAILLIYIPIGFIVDRYLPFVSGKPAYFYKNIVLRKRQQKEELKNG